MEITTIAYYLKKFRNENNLSLLEFGEMTGLSASYIMSLEKGVCIPNEEIIAKIACSISNSDDDCRHRNEEMLNLVGYEVNTDVLEAVKAGESLSRFMARRMPVELDVMLEIGSEINYYLHKKKIS